MASSTYVIHRGNGVYTPLIAVDELPHAIQLQETPRVLCDREVRGLSLECLAEVPANTFRYTVVLQPPMSPKAPCAFVDSVANFGSSLYKPPHDSYLPGDNTLSPFNRPLPSGGRSFGAVGTPCPPSTASRAFSMGESKWRKDDSSSDEIKAGKDDRIVRIANHSIGPTSRPLPPSGAEPDDGKKRYCTFWIRNGECDYTQQGCLYLHEMPDELTLSKIGFRDVPKWWREKLRVAARANEKAKERQAIANGDWRVRSSAERGVLTARPHAIGRSSSGAPPGKLGKPTLIMGQKAGTSSGTPNANGKYKAPGIRDIRLDDDGYSVVSEALIDLAEPLVPERASSVRHGRELYVSDSSSSPANSSVSVKEQKASSTSSGELSPSFIHPPRFVKQTVDEKSDSKARNAPATDKAKPGSRTGTPKASNSSGHSKAPSSASSDDGDETTATGTEGKKGRRSGNRRRHRGGSKKPKDAKAGEKKVEVTGTSACVTVASTPAPVK